MGRGAFLRFLTAVPLAALAGPSPASAPAKPEAKAPEAKGPKLKTRRWGMAIDMDLCTGCGACVVACHVENNVPFTGSDPRLKGTQIDWMSLLPMGRRIGGDVQVTPMPCMHCDNPPCVKVCPTNATYKGEDGIVEMVYDRCIGCRYCMNACPYSRRYFNWAEPSFPGSHQQALNPDVPTRPEGVMEKCNFCVHRIRKVKEDSRAEGREITDEEVRFLPACAQTCPVEAIVFGDLDDSESLVSKQAQSPRASRMLEHLGTEPKVYYLAKEKRVASEGKEV